MKISALALVLFAAPAFADVVPPDCVPRFPAEENDSCGRDRAVVIFHNACGATFKSGSCHLQANPNLPKNCDQLKACMDNGGDELGRIAAHVLEWELNHGCEGNQNCISIHKDLCLGRGDGLQLRRRLLRCSQFARNKLNNMSADLFKSKKGTGAGNHEFWNQLGADLAAEVAAGPPGAKGGPPGPVGSPGPSAASSSEGSPSRSESGAGSVSADQFERLLGMCLDKADDKPEVALACLRELRSEMRDRRMRSTEGSRTR
jgi:hypothetical protein